MNSFLFLLSLSLFAQASSYTLGQRLVQLIPEGYSEGVTEKGAPCRLIFSSMPDPDPSKIEYARAQVIAEPEGNLVDVEIFFDGYEGKVWGKWGPSEAEVHYRQVFLSAHKTSKGVLVRTENKKTGLSASCLVKP